MVMYAKIRRRFFREHCSISEIASRTSLTRNTIKKWLKSADGAEPKYLRHKSAGKLTAFEPKLLLALEADAHRPKHDRRTALMLSKPSRRMASQAAMHVSRPLYGFGAIKDPLPVPKLPLYRLSLH